MRKNKELLIISLLGGGVAQELRQRFAASRPEWAIEFVDDVMDSMVAASLDCFDGMVAVCPAKYAHSAMGSMHFFMRNDRKPWNCFVYVIDQPQANTRLEPGCFGHDEFNQLLSALAKELDPRHAGRKPLAAAR
jgi:hypothetical protein